MWPFQAKVAMEGLFARRGGWWGSAARRQTSAGGFVGKRRMRDNGAEWKNCKTTPMQNMCHDYLFLEKYIFGAFPKKSLTQVWLVRLFTLFSACESQGEQSSFARNQTRCIVLSRGIKEEVSSSRKWNDAWWCNTGPTTSLQIYPKSTTPLHSSDLGPRLGCLDTWVERRLLDFLFRHPFFGFVSYQYGVQRIICSSYCRHTP